MNTKTNANSMEWRIDEEYYLLQDEYRAIIDAGGKVIVHVLNENFYEDISNQEAESNAKLIAAAPELLEALKELLTHALEYDLHGEITEKAKEIIKKATT